MTPSRNGSEIDIMEKPWLDDRVQHTLHWDGYGKDHKSEGYKATVPGVMDGWHTFGLLWLPDEYVFLVESRLVPTGLNWTSSARRMADSW